MKMSTLIIIALLSLNIVANMSSAEIDSLPPASQGDCVSLLQSYGNSTYTTLKRVITPKEIITLSADMTNDGTGSYNYTFCRTKDIGEYIYETCTDVDGSDPCIIVQNSFIIDSPARATMPIDTGTAVILGLIFLICIFAYTRISRFIGALGIFMLGFGILFLNPENGWMGWIIILIGFVSTMYALLTPKTRMRRRF